VAKLKLDGSGSREAEGAGAADAGTAPPSGAMPLDPARAATGPGAGSRIAAKADSLRSYLNGQMEHEAYVQVYRLVRSSGEVSTEILQQQVASVIGVAKAQELFTLFQLLCFLEDVAKNNAESAEVGAAG